MNFTHTYSPVGLVVDDKPDIFRRVLRAVLENTSLGVLFASDLKTAAAYVKDASIKFDFLVTDFGFAREFQHRSQDLIDGLDLAELLKKHRPNAPVWVYSSDVDDKVFQERARKKKVEIEEWLFKPASRAFNDSWIGIERKCLMKTLQRSEELRTVVAKEADVEIAAGPLDTEIIERIRTRIHFPRQTYLTQLPDNYKVIHPIEVQLLQREQGMHVASTPNLGLIVKVEAATPKEALDKMSETIVEEFSALKEKEGQLVGYAEYVLGKLKESIQAPD
ncbi:MAG: hypothetical protein B7Z37_22060 [Verrucomicrobia bacterium 12-59-8]|nr:MAG: hypothetical protein B7Z37_22060 [Verrucomicrobia bacterium 12-59-8]